MFDTVKTDLTNRLMELRLWINSMNEEDPYVKISKGLFFVYMYGIWESIVQQIVFGTIDEINDSNELVSNCNYELYSLIFSPEYDAIYGAGTATKWPKRWRIPERLNSNEKVHINAEIPTDGKNIRYAQLESISKSFGVGAPIVPEAELRGRLEEIVNNRNSIAHGDKTPAEVGGRYSKQDIITRCDQMETLAMYVISVYERYVLNRNYLRT